MDDHVRIERRGGVQIIRINRPDKKNALTRAMYGAMAEALVGGDCDPSVRVHVLFGAPGAFCAGNDLSDFMSVAMGGEAGSEVGEFLTALACLAKPLLAGVDGVAVGIGTTIQLHCDLTFATPRTLFTTPFVELGLVPEAGSSLLAPAVLGRQQAFALLALGEPFSAERALQAGLIWRIVPEGQLEASVLDAALALAARPPEALTITRELMRPPRAEIMARIEEESAHFRERLISQEARAAFSAFFQRRKAR